MSFGQHGNPSTAPRHEEASVVVGKVALRDSQAMALALAVRIDRRIYSEASDSESKVTETISCQVENTDIQRTASEIYPTVAVVTLSRFVRKHREWKDGYSDFTRASKLTVSVGRDPDGKWKCSKAEDLIVTDRYEPEPLLIKPKQPGETSDLTWFVQQRLDSLP